MSDLVCEIDVHAHDPRVVGLRGGIRFEYVRELVAEIGFGDDFVDGIEVFRHDWSDGQNPCPRRVVCGNRCGGVRRLDHLLERKVLGECEADLVPEHRADADALDDSAAGALDDVFLEVEVRGHAVLEKHVRELGSLRERRRDDL